MDGGSEGGGDSPRSLNKLDELLARAASGAVHHPLEELASNTRGLADGGGRELPVG